MSLIDLNVGAIQEALRAGTISEAELVQAYLAHLEKMEASLNAFITITCKEAMVRARELERLRKTGKMDAPLFGVPFSLQDNLCTAGIHTTCASKMLANFIPPYNAIVYEQIQAAGGVLLGKNNMNEFGMENAAPALTKEPVNPWDESRAAGDGAAAAVAAKQVVFALASDTGGSLRQSAAYCGVVGLKPTYGRVSRHGLISFASSLVQVGCLTGNVADSATVLQVLAVPDAKDSTTGAQPVPSYQDFLTQGVNGLRVGLPQEYLAGLDAGVKARVKQAAATLEKLGAVVEEISLPHSGYAVLTYQLLSAGEAFSDLSNFDGVRFGLREEGKNLHDMYRKTRTAGFGAGVRRNIVLGTLILSADFYADYFLTAQKMRTLICQDFQQVWDQYDLVLGPVTAGIAPVRSDTRWQNEQDIYQDSRFTCAVNLADYRL
ncbi:MAG: amidase [bacterium]